MLRGKHLGFPKIRSYGVLYGDNGKQNGNYYLGLGIRV